eukprot:2978362-Pyramimonas_sp.AAC.1
MQGASAASIVEVGSLGPSARPVVRSSTRAAASVARGPGGGAPNLQAMEQAKACAQHEQWLQAQKT